MSHPFQIEIAESEEELKKRLQTGKPERKATDVIVAQEWAGKGTAGNRKTLGQRYFNCDKMVTEI